MRRRFLARFLGLATLALTVVAAPSFVWAAKSDKGPIKAKPDGEVVEMFVGMKSGDIEVTFIAKDAHEATVLFRNKTDKALAIQLPEAFAGVPVLAQFGQNPFGNLGNQGLAGNQGIGQQNNTPQGLGGNFGQNGGANGLNGLNGPGFMNVGPDKVRKLKVNTVCLEHGKPDPNPRLAYEIRPIESFTSNADVIELCKLIGRSEMSQNAAQAAAWHLANGLSFEQLAKKNRLVRLNGVSEKFFTPKELQSAAKVVKQLHKSSGPPTEGSLAKAPSQSQN